MQYYFTRVSSNRKTGPMPVVTASKKTCPTSCPLQDNGCYAEAGPIAIRWRAVTSGSKGISFADLCRRIRRLPRGQIWRYGQAGDLPGEGDEIDGEQLGELAAANARRPAIVFTHKPPTAGNLKHPFRPPRTGVCTSTCRLTALRRQMSLRAPGSRL
jgi:hypothetical protein